MPPFCAGSPRRNNESRGTWLFSVRTGASFHTSALKLPFLSPSLGFIKRGRSWLRYFWAQLALSPGRDSGPLPRMELNAAPCLLTPRSRGSAQCPVLAEPPSWSQLQEDMAGQVRLETA